MSHPESGRPDHSPPGTDLLAGLTPEQARAVTHGTGPLLLIAGPRAGKTRTLTHRVAYLLESEHGRPEQILSVTFSVRAAGEMRHRLTDLLGQERARRVAAATFRSVCAWLLREHAHVVLGGPTGPELRGKAFKRTRAYVVDVLGEEVNR
jgi:ATP-dependent DNA helicase UvrD/PcrA